MLNKKKNVIVILHYDLATRYSIDKEWTSLISHSPDGQTFRHRPIFFASENWKHIFSLIVDMYERLTAAASIVSKKTGTTANLWKKTNAFMTDAASKNLEVKNLLQAYWIPNNNHMIFLVRAVLWRNLIIQTSQCLAISGKVSNCGIHWNIFISQLIFSFVEKKEYCRTSYC